MKIGFYGQKEVDELKRSLEAKYGAQIAELEKQLVDLKRHWTSPEEAIKMQGEIYYLKNELQNLGEKLKHEMQKVSGLLGSVVKWKKEARKKDKEPLPPGNIVEQTLHRDGKRSFYRWKEIVHHHPTTPIKEIWALAEDLAAEYKADLIEVDFRYGNWHAVFYQYDK